MSRVPHIGIVHGFGRSAPLRAGLAPALGRGFAARVFAGFFGSTPVLSRVRSLVRSLGLRRVLLVGLVGGDPGRHRRHQAQHRQCKQRAQRRDLPQAEPGREADGAGQPHAGPGGEPLHLATRKHDGAGGQEGHTRRHRLDGAQRIDGGALAAAQRRRMHDLERQDAHHGRRDADQDVGAQARRPVPPFALEADRGAQQGGQGHAGGDDGKRQPRRPGEFFQEVAHGKSLMGTGLEKGSGSQARQGPPEGFGLRAGPARIERWGANSTRYVDMDGPRRG